MNILDIYRDFNIRYADPGHRHYREGWLNTECPFCSGNEGFHLGATLNGDRFYCWRCGWHPTKLSLSKILKIPEQKVTDVIRDYAGDSFIYNEPKVIDKKPFKRPSNIIEFTQKHTSYISSRNFDINKLITDWGIKATGPISLLNGIL